jgi:SAM-dependent methyltransferase
MARTKAFDQHLDLYEEWFTQFQPVFESEVAALSQVIRPDRRSVEIGVGSGLFAQALGIGEGLEPSPVMAARARERGIAVEAGVAEALPYEDQQFDLALMVTAICFVDDPKLTGQEMFRVVKPGGRVVMGFVDQASPLGEVYEQFKDQNVFYRDATFYTATDVVECLESTGFQLLSIRQTVFGMLDEITEAQPVRPGHGDGGFVVVEALRP